MHFWKFDCCSSERYCEILWLLVLPCLRIHFWSKIRTNWDIQHCAKVLRRFLNGSHFCQGFEFQSSPCSWSVSEQCFCLLNHSSIKNKRTSVYCKNQFCINSYIGHILNRNKFLPPQQILYWGIFSQTLLTLCQFRQYIQLQRGVASLRTERPVSIKSLDNLSSYGISFL